MLELEKENLSLIIDKFLNSIISSLIEEEKLNKKCYKCKSSESIRFYVSNYSCYNCYLKDKEYFLALENNKTVIFPDMNKITEKIFLGNSDSGRDINLLIKNKITHIMIVGSFLFPFYQNDFNYKILEIEDREDQETLSHFKEAFQFIESAIDSNGKILIHCFAGKCRSPSFVIGYLMYKHKQPYTKIYSYVKNKRNSISINNGFKLQLISFSNDLYNN
jgi:protein-tyrosine phosphatase